MVTWGTPLGCRRATVARPTLKATPTGAALSPKLQLGEAVGSTLINGCRHLRVPGYPRPILTLPKTIAYQGAVAGVGTRLRQCGTSGLLMGAIGWSGRPPASQQAKLARGRQSQGARHVTQTQQRSRRDRRRNRQGLVRRGRAGQA